MGGKGNKLLPILALAALALLVFVLGRPGKEQAQAPQPPRRAPAPDADSAADTVRSLTAKLQQIQAETEGLRQENQKLLQQGPEFTNKLKAEVADELKRQRNGENQELAKRVDDLAKRSTGVVPSQPSPANSTTSLPGNLNGLSLGQSGDLARDLGRVVPGSGGSSGGMVWIQPLDHDPAAPIGTVPSANPASLLHEGGALEPPKARPPEPAYTVPRNATLVGSTAMTALIGRVPVKGQVEDPFPFKVLVGRDNLAANGLEIPDVNGMVFSGTAFGDWTLGCVRGTVKSVTFLFDDGTIRTVSADNLSGGNVGAGIGAVPGNAGAGTSSGAASGGVAGRGLGWISDRRGIPCVTGSRISNAVDYLSGRMLARGIETAGQAFARAQTTVNTTPLGGYTSAVTGNVMNYALGQTAAGGADELAKWIADRQSQMFDVVYVDTGAEVAVHIDHEITIDYEPNGRKLYHARATTASTHSGGLD
jgi:hypothetical protein